MSTTTQRAQYVVNRTNELFGNDVYLRIIHYCREASLEAEDHYSPKFITPFLVGHPGYGKTSRIRWMCKQLGISCVIRKTAGIMDAEAIFGAQMTRLNPKTGEPETVWAKPAWWPREGTEGIVVWDDVNRAHPHIFDSVMDLFNEGQYNDAILPEGWTSVCTGNPEDGEHVMSMDKAQQSRMLTLAYSRAEEIFFEQMSAQDMDTDLHTLYLKDKLLVREPELEIGLPADNDRSKFIFGHIYRFLKLDDEALKIAAASMFGIHFVAKINQARSDKQPFDPEDVLNNWLAFAPIMKDFEDEGRNDLIAHSTLRMIAYLNHREPSSFTDQQFQNLTDFGVALPDNEGTWLIQRVFDPKSPHGKEYGQKIAAATKQASGLNGPFMLKVKDVIIQTNKAVAAATAGAGVP